MNIQPRRIPYVIVAIVAAVLLFAPFAALAAPGDLDTSFDGDGIVITPIGAGQDLAGSEIAIQADGKLVQAGTTTTGPGNNDFAVVRYNTDGSLDTTFDGDGIIILDWGEMILARRLRCRRMARSLWWVIAMLKATLILP